MNYETYSCPSSTQKYSSEYFSTLTFAQATNLDYPSILPPDSIPSWVWHADVPGSALANLILSSDVVPHLADLQPILKKMLEAFSLGSRSVILKLIANGEEKHVHYHFAKINLFRLINNNEMAVNSARRLVQELSTSLPAASLVHFQQQRVSAPIHGFFGSAFPLWKLGCLLDENWLEEDVLNAIAEITYFREAAWSPVPTRIPSILYLPTSFFNDTNQLFTGHLYSSELLNLWCRLEQTAISAIGFIVWHADHFAVYYTAGAGQLYHGDSLSPPPHMELLEMLKWVFDGLWSEFEAPGEIIQGTVERQGSGNGGGGSCGMAAHNFIESSIDPTVPRWQGQYSANFQMRMLLDPIIYHEIATMSTKPLLQNWWFPCMELVGYQEVSGFTGYQDFNMYAPTPSHPIYTFLAREHPTLSIFMPSLPLVDGLDTAQISHGTAMSPLLLPFIQKMQVKPKCSPSLEIITDFVITPSFCGVKRELSVETISPKSSRQRNVKAHFRSPSVTIISPPKLPKKQIQSKQELEDIKLSALAWKQEIDLASQNVSVALGVIRTGVTFDSLEDAQQAILQAEASLGHIWRVGQSKQDTSGKKRKVTLHCRRYQLPGQNHSLNIDPSDHQTGNSIRTNCSAHVNVNCVGKTSVWHITTVDLRHNHDHEIPEGGHICRPATKDQELITQLAVSPVRYNCSQVMNICNTQFTGSTLEPCQISLLITAARKQAKVDG
ncbi:hypothetical protein BDN71DRAFT_1436402 [Pleurotus eryngii]|uniref:Uncharacterized protein n=1 Tax=Pleurotus eryngii TaxID=5323 RepID=A0A9P5ZIK1_PLEER|nr:hypothetical protein BDN71DRAFT_1436402 [Pleurotus eryngii]